MSSIVFTVTVFFFAIWFPGPENVIPSDVTLHENNGQFSLEFDPIQFASPKSGRDWFFVGPDITAIDNHLKANHGVALDLNAQYFTQDVNFTTNTGEKKLGSIGGVQDHYGTKVLGTWLPLHYDTFVGMDAVTVDIDVVPLAAASSVRRADTSNTRTSMVRYVENGVRSEYLREYGEVC